MHLSIFSFNKQRRTHYLRLIGLFMLIVPGLLLTLNILSRNVAALAYSNISNADKDLPPGRWFIDYGFGVNLLSHRAYYYNFENAVTPAQDADVLLLGNSRVLFAFPKATMDRFAEDHGIRYFNLGLGFHETFVFPEKIITRNRIFPKLVIINDDDFFKDGLSSFSADVVSDFWWNNMKDRIENRLFFFYTVHMKDYVPHFYFQLSNVRALFRSWSTGSWYPWLWETSIYRFPVKDDPVSRGLDEAYIHNAEHFCNFLKARGATVVLTHVPSTRNIGSAELARQLAARLGIPFIRPELEGLVTLDKSHLDEASAKRFSEAFLDELVKTSGFQNINKGRTPPSPGGNRP